MIFIASNSAKENISSILGEGLDTRPIRPIETRASSTSQKTFNALAIVRGGKTPLGTDSVCQSGDNNRSIDRLSEAQRHLIRDFGVHVADI